MYNDDVVAALDRLTTEIKVLKDAITTEIKVLKDAIEAPRMRKLALKAAKKEKEAMLVRAADAGYLDNLYINMLMSTLERERMIDKWLSQPFYVRWFNDNDNINKYSLSYQILSCMTTDERKKYLLNEEKKILNDIKCSNDVAVANGLPVWNAREV